MACTRGCARSASGRRSASCDPSAPAWPPSCSTAPASPTPSCGTSYSLTEVGRAAALAAVDEQKLVAFFIWRTDGQPPVGNAWRNCATPSPGRAGTSRPCWTCCRSASDYFDDVAQVVMPGWTWAGRPAWRRGVRGLAVRREGRDLGDGRCRCARRRAGRPTGQDRHGARRLRRANSPVGGNRATYGAPEHPPVRAREPL